MEAEGVVASGLGRGSFFAALPLFCASAEAVLGAAPYPGTLNLRVEQETLGRVLPLMRASGTRLEGFDHEGRRYGGCWLLPCAVGGLRAALVRPDLTGHDDVLEVVATVNLREALGVGDGDRVPFRVPE